MVGEDLPVWAELTGDELRVLGWVPGKYRQGSLPRTLQHRMLTWVGAGGVSRCRRAVAMLKARGLVGLDTAAGRVVLLARGEAVRADWQRQVKRYEDGDGPWDASETARLEVLSRQMTRRLR